MESYTINHGLLESVSILSQHDRVKFKFYLNKCLGVSVSQKHNSIESTPLVDEEARHFTIIDHGFKNLQSLHQIRFTCSVNANERIEVTKRNLFRCQTKKVF